MQDGYDEVFAEPGRPREHAVALADALAELGPDALSDAGRMRDSIFMQQGITFDAGGADADGPVRDRPFPLDLVPRIIPGEEWRSIKRGLAQRIRALNAFVDDVYHAREIVHEGIAPWELIVSRSAFARAAHGIRPPGGVYCHVSGCDLVRDGDGSWKVLEDNVRTPSVISYMLENRVAMTRLVPGLFGSYRVHPVDHYPALLVYPYVPQMIRFYLSEEPILENVRTYLMADPEQRRAALERLDELDVKPVDESGGKGVFIGPAADDAAIARRAEEIQRRPERWIAQELVKLSTWPTASPVGELVPRHVDLRPFAVFGEDIHIVPGGLTRVALREGSMIVNSSQGGGSKDTWVLEERPGEETAALARPDRWSPPVQPGLRQGGAWSGQQQQQQQQQG